MRGKSRGFKILRILENKSELERIFGRKESLGKKIKKPKNC